MSKIQFADNLKAYRKKANMSQGELADIIYTARQTISAWESGNGKPDVYSLDLLCQIFKTTPDIFLYADLKEEGNLNEDKMKSEFDSLSFFDDVDPYQQTYKKGFYNFIEEDIIGFSHGLGFDVTSVAVEVSKMGYQVTDVFANGFSVYFKTDEEGEKFKRDMYNLFEDVIHYTFEDEEDWDYFSNLSSKTSAILSEEALSRIYGDKIRNFPYQWEDEDGNIRGYAKTKEECQKQAEEQECKECIISSFDWSSPTLAVYGQIPKLERFIRIFPEEQRIDVLKELLTEDELKSLMETAKSLIETYEKSDIASGNK